jgi:hypothetical protein
VAEMKCYKLILPFDETFFDELRARKIEEARFMIYNDQASPYMFNRIAILTAMDFEMTTILEARNMFYYGMLRDQTTGKDDPTSIDKEDRVRARVDKLSADAAISIKMGRWS